MDIEQLVLDTKIYVDTSSLLHTHAELFFYDCLTPVLLRHNKNVTIPSKVIDEIENIINKSPDKRRSAKIGKAIIKRYYSNNIIDKKRGRNDLIADNIFLCLFMENLTKYNLTLLTQDVDLAKDIKRLKTIRSVNSSKSIQVFKLNSHGNIVEWEFDNTCPSENELMNWCSKAIILEREALLGVPKENRTQISNKYAPYQSSNFEKWEKAAEAGLPEGQYLQGKFLLNEGDLSISAMDWLRKASSQGFLLAKTALGEFLIDNGNSDEGVALLQEAANKGEAIACFGLAMRYEDGDGVIKSKGKYLDYLKRAASLGHETAQFYLSMK